MKKPYVFICMLLISACTLNPFNRQQPNIEPAVTKGNTIGTDTSALNSTPEVISPNLSTPALGLRTEIPDVEMAPTITFTPVPPQSTSTPVPTLTPTSTPVPGSTPARYVLQSGIPKAIPNFTHPELGCNWMGVGGQVFAPDGAPVVGLVVEVVGVLNGKQIAKLALTGNSTAFGPGGYEILLENKAISSQSALYVQLFDLDGKPISGQIYFNTYADCSKNLIVVNFIDQSLALPLKNYIPGIHKTR